MTLRIRNLAVVLGLLALGSFALSPAGCGTNSGSSQGGSNAPTGTGGVTGGNSGSGTGGSVLTGYACSGGGGESGTGTTVPRSCYPYAPGSFYCNAGVCGCYYNRVTGCLCADNTVSPCMPLDPTCTAATAGGTDNIPLGTADPKTNVSCSCDRIGYWWCY